MSVMIPSQGKEKSFTSVIFSKSALYKFNHPSYEPVTTKSLLNDVP
jgi:hypothetical protein